jgi:hypothetical protein
MDRHRVSERGIRRWIILNENRQCQMTKRGRFRIISGEGRYPIIGTRSDRGRNELIVKLVSEPVRLDEHGESSREFLSERFIRRWIILNVKDYFITALSV